MAKVTGSKAKYTESELKDRGIGVQLNNVGDMQKWRTKKITYMNEGIWKSFTILRDSFRILFRNPDNIDGVVQGEYAAQTMMDTFLVRRARGVNVSIPKEVVPVNAVPDDDGVALISGEGFSGKEVSENEKLRWIFENMQAEGLEPSSAPSMGTWSLLLELRESTEQRRDFYKTLWPKLLTKEDAEKGGKLQDSGKETIALIDRLIAALPESEE